MPKKLYPVEQLIFGSFFRFLVKEINGMENIPKDRPVILCANHTSYIDGPLPLLTITYALNKKIHAYINATYYRFKVLKLFFDRTESIKIYSKDFIKSRPYDNTRGFQLADKYLAKGDFVLIFPEGKRSWDGKLLPGKVGAAHLSIKNKVPVIPIGIVGTRAIMKKGDVFPRIHKKCVINIGKPIYPDVGLESKHEFTRRIMKEIGKLSGEEYNH